MSMLLGVTIFLIAIFLGERLWSSKELPARAVVLVSVLLSWTFVTLLVMRTLHLLGGQVALAWVIALLAWLCVRILRVARARSRT